MAGDWIKMRGNLWDDPRVSRICDLTKAGEAAVIGGLYWLWNSADQHTESGAMVGLTLSAIDRKSGVKGLGAALVAVGWLAEESDGVRILNFQDHNGASAKRRSEDAKRKANVRKDSDKTRTDDGLLAESLGRISELEKELEEEKRKSKDKDTVPNGTGGKPPTDRDLVFAKGVPLITTAGVTEKNARSMLAMLSQKHGESAVLTALEQTAHDRPGEPVAWLQSLLKARPQSTGETAYQKSQRERVESFAPGIAKRGANTIDEVPNVVAIASR